jgi:hypothetical protein
MYQALQWRETCVSLACERGNPPRSLTFRLLRITSTTSGSIAVARLSKASRPSTALSPLAGPRAVGGMCIFPTFIIDRQRELRYSGHSTAARSAARQPSVVSLPMEVRKCLAQTRSATPWSSGQCPFRCVGLLSKRSSQCARRSRKHWKCDALHTRSII